MARTLTTVHSPEALATELGIEPDAIYSHIARGEIAAVNRWSDAKRRYVEMVSLVEGAVLRYVYRKGMTFDEAREELSDLLGREARLKKEDRDERLDQEILREKNQRRIEAEAKERDERAAIAKAWLKVRGEPMPRVPDYEATRR